MADNHALVIGLFEFPGPAAAAARALRGHGVTRERVSIVARNHDGVRSLGQARAFERKRLTEQSLDAVALHCAADLPRHGQPEAWWPRLLTSREHVQHELSARMRAALAEHTIEISAPGQPCSPRPRPRPRLRAHQTVSRLRPLSRRRLSVRRPARVCMRVRNPCVRARLRFFGW